MCLCAKLALNCTHMKHLSTFIALLCFAGIESASATGRAMPTEFLHPLFSDHAVLQRDVAVPIWGTGPAGGMLSVSFGEQTKQVTVGDDGKWMCTLDPMPASFEGRTLQVADFHQVSSSSKAGNLT